MSAKIVSWSTGSRSKTVEAFLRRPAFDPAAETAAAAVLSEIRARGEPALLEAIAKFDRAPLAASELRVSDAEIAAAAKSVPPALKRAVREAHARIVRFSKAGMAKSWTIPTPRGGILGEQFTPLDRVGAYIPGGVTPLASTALMTVTLASVAGVKEIVACTPCDADKSVNPVLLHALKVAGATEVYRVGGIQAIGLMAYGACGIRPVRKIVGPGGAYVTAAKRQVYGSVALDLVAGPSEIAVLADSTARPEWVAADLLSQIEHGTGNEKALLATDSMELAKAVRDEVEAQSKTLTRAGRVRRTIAEGGVLLVVVPDIAQGVDLVNDFAPEHLELAVARPRALAPKVTAAGAIFLGHWTPESAGDFVAGPSHVLPTGGAAHMFSGLTVGDFMRRSSLVGFTREDLAETLPVIEAFGAVERLDGHARAATIRCRKH